MTRFTSIKQAISYCGLCGDEKSSADKVMRMPISKQRNKHIQRVLIEAAKLGPRECHELAEVRAKELEKGDRNRATLAVARKMVCYLLAGIAGIRTSCRQRNLPDGSGLKTFPNKEKAKISGSIDAQAARSRRSRLGEGTNSRGPLRIVSGLAENTNSIICDGSWESEAANGCPVLHRQEPPPRGTIALEGILIRSNARSPKRARKTRAFNLTLTYMDATALRSPRQQMDVWFCIGRNLRREAHIAPEGILIRSTARSPKRARKNRAFHLTLTYMDVGYPSSCITSGLPVIRQLRKVSATSAVCRLFMWLPGLAELMPRRGHVPLTITQIDNEALLPRTDSQFGGKSNWKWDSPGPCKGCSESQHHAYASKAHEHMPPRSRVLRFVGWSIDSGDSDYAFSWLSTHRHRHCLAVIPDPQLPLSQPSVDANLGVVCR